MIQEFHPQEQPAGSYKYMLNGLKNLTGSVQAEKGTAVRTAIPSGHAIVGSYVLGTDEILFLKSEDSCQIGILTDSDTYTTIVIEPEFNLDYGIEIEGRKDYRGHRIVYFVVKDQPVRRLDLDELPENILEDSRLFLDFSTPLITSQVIGDGGALPSGIYQFAARLVTSGGNSTPFGFISNPIPVVDDIKAAGSDGFDGALPQTDTNKLINLTISNLDTSYDYVEIVAITYVGTDNGLEAHIVGKKQVINSVVTFTYSSTEQQTEELVLENLLEDFAYYDSAEHITQKDNVLLLSNVKATIHDVDFQAIANDIVAKYVIFETPHFHYQPVEYADADGNNISNWASNNVVWTPTGSWRAANAGTTSEGQFGYKNESYTAELKGFMRGEVYSLAIVPRWKHGGDDFAYHIPGSSAVAIAANITTKQLGTYISTEEYPTGQSYPTGNVRHHRMPTLAQEPHITYPADGTVTLRILGIKLENIIIPDEIKDQLEGFSIVMQPRDSNQNRTIVSQGVAKNLFTINDEYVANAPNYGNLELQDIFTSYTVDKRLFAFYSPDLMHGVITDPSFSHIKSEGKLRITTVADNRSTTHLDPFLVSSYLTSDYFVPTAGLDQQLDTITREIDPMNDTTIAKTSLPYSGSKPIWNKWTNGYTVYRCLVDLTRTYDYHESYNNNGGSTTEVYASLSSTRNLDLYNLKNNIANCYGDVSDAEYIIVGQKLYSIPQYPRAGSIFPMEDSEIECFNGDTFISKYSLVLKDQVPTEEAAYSPQTSCMLYLYFETQGNYEYRHYIEVDGDEAGTVPYFPKYSVIYDTATPLGILNIDPELGHSLGYNKQYSISNILRKYYPKPINWVPVEHYSNRTIHSEQAIEGETVDAYRLFLENNYHDVPKNRGEITSIFVHNNQLYIHTAQTLFRSFFNEATTQATSSGEVYLGNGGLFPRPSIELYTVSGGYAGTSHGLASQSTPFGRFFIDSNQGKVFLLTDRPVEISYPSMRKYFETNLTAGRYLSAYDYSNRRWILTKVGSWTISYSLDGEPTWASFHSYVPDHIYSKGNRVMMSQEETNFVFELNKGLHGHYLGQDVQPFKIEFVMNPYPTEMKSFDNLEFYTSSSRDGIEKHYDTFNWMQIYNKVRNTGNLLISVPKTWSEEHEPRNMDNVMAKLKGNEFKVAIPGDLVNNPELDIFVASNLVSHESYSAQQKLFRPRITGNYAVLKLQYNNNDDNDFIVHAVRLLYRPVAR